MPALPRVPLPSQHGFDAERLNNRAPFPYNNWPLIFPFFSLVVPSCQRLWALLFRLAALKWISDVEVFFWASPLLPPLPSAYQ